MIRIRALIEDPYQLPGRQYEAILADGRHLFLSLRRYQAAISGWDARGRAS